MAVRKPSQHNEIAQAAAQLGAYVEGLSAKFGEAPKSHALARELEAIARAAGVFWRALQENGIPVEFRQVMFDNWQESLWASGEAVLVELECAADDEEPA